MFSATELFDSNNSSGYNFFMLRINKVALIFGFIGGDNEYIINENFFTNNKIDLISATATVDVPSSITVTAVIKKLEGQKSIYIGETAYAVHFCFIGIFN